MSKYSQDMNYIYYKNTNIPINKLNIRNPEAPEEEERNLLPWGYEYLDYQDALKIKEEDNKYIKAQSIKWPVKIVKFTG